MTEVAVAFKIQEEWKELLPEGIVSLQRYVTSSSPSLHKLGDPPPPSFVYSSDSQALIRDHRLKDTLQYISND